MTQNTSPEWIQTVSPLIAALRRGHYLLYSQSIEPLGNNPGERPYQEVLIRYFEEERHMLPPGMFFPILEEQGLMSLLDCWVVNQVLKLQGAAAASKPDWHAPRNSVNLSSNSIVDPEFATFVRTQLKARNAAPDILSFEVPLTVALDHVQALGDLIASLQPVDCSFAISGFDGSATGLALLANLPITFVKLDGGLVRRMQRTPEDFGRLKQANDACHALGIRTIAEQVEDNDTLAALTRLGVDFAQGYGISKPGPMLAD